LNLNKDKVLGRNKSFDVKITIIDNLVSFNLSGNTNHRSFSCGDKVLILNIPDAYLPISMRNLKLKILLVDE
jgi:hypothetical protein